MGSCLTVPIPFKQYEMDTIINFVESSRCMNLRSLEPEDITIVDPELMATCPICLEVARYPIIFPCGHLACHVCFETDHSRESHQLCYICRQPIELLHLRTISEELSTRPQSAISKFYSMAEAKCMNSKCYFTGHLSELTAHELVSCPTRQIKCPAHNCYLIGPASAIIDHTIQCQRHRAWCVGCGQYIERRYLNTKHYCIRSYVPISSRCWFPKHWPKWASSHRHGEVELPAAEEYKPDADLIDRIKHQVQLRNGLKTLRKYRTQEALNESHDFLIDESTQLDFPN